MKLISSREALVFLSQAAPKPWVQRLLRWMAFDEGLLVYSRKGKVQAYGSVVAWTSQLFEKSKQMSGPDMDAAIREEFDDEIAAKLVGKDPFSRVDDEPFVWDETEEPKILDIGFFLYATEIDWGAGTLKAEYLPGDGELRDIFFENSEFLDSEIESPEFEAEVEGLCFELSKIEMLLPSLELGQSIGFTASQTEQWRPVGRPQKWDWEGAMAATIAQAQHPDGLPTGPGAQAKIEASIADWFIAEAGNSPSTSQIRKRASTIMRMIETPKTTKTT